MWQSNKGLMFWTKCWKCPEHVQDLMSRTSSTTSGGAWCSGHFANLAILTKNWRRILAKPISRLSNRLGTFSTFLPLPEVLDVLDVLPFWKELDTGDRRTLAKSISRLRIVIIEDSQTILVQTVEVFIMVLLSRT